MNRRISKLSKLVGLGSAALVGGCFWGAPDVGTLAEPYRFVEIDTRESMMLKICQPDNFCSGDGLPNPTIFAGGADSRYVVLARHPGGNRKVTEYYYLIRTKDELHGLPPENVRGPFSLADFQVENAHLRLPPFSTTFRDLK
jgi:hypothetical protein